MISQYKLLVVMIVAALSGCQGDENTTLESGNDNIYVPIVKGEVTLPSLHVGTTARGTYEYFDPNVQPRKEATSLYVWRDQHLAEVSKEREIKLDYEHLGNSLSFCVTPIAQGDKNTIGQENCSKEVEVKEPLADKPTVVDVVIDGNTIITVGDTLEGTYSYLHIDDLEQGATELRWKADGAEIVGKISNLIKLTAAETEGKEIVFCVTPITAVTDNNPAIKGDEVCSDITTKVLPFSGDAPVVESVSIDGSPFVHAELTGIYQYSDANDDLESNSQYIWKRDTDVIPSQTEKTYKVTSDDLNTTISFCVMPKAATGLPNSGSETCFSMDKVIEEIVENAPTAKDVIISVDGGIATVGKELQGTFTYTQVQNAAQGIADIQWKRGDTIIKECEDNESDCLTYVVTDTDLTNENIIFSVTPKTLYETSGVLTPSSAILASGLKLSGKLEYNAEITATGFGDFQDLSAIEWRINTNTQDGPLGDTDPGSRTSILEANGASSYRIGVVGDSKNDLDWNHSKLVDARNFIGKNLDVCVNDYCINASDSQVTGGMYVTGSVDNKRTIEPVRYIKNGQANYHRPLTVLEVQNKTLGDLPTFKHIITLNGIDWAAYDHDDPSNKDILNVCRKLDKGQWHLPVSWFKESKDYVINQFSSDGNNPPVVQSDSLIAISKNLMKDTTDELSNVFGWPVAKSSPYASATMQKSNKSLPFRVFYFDGSNSSTTNNNVARVVSCVESIN
ncbi:hypothetical protein CJF25_03550 [Photobacterium phosphoreum]|uniref:hypothetical protein n=1 Tax=Photobacterium phosphoreum TaxID=659 RepID=UPI001E57AD6C|nr:hypothetical protein [Photobacterium phosphoreum]MCD9462078.1 hypothetical protein [Photobacterium phosphoreum]